jgi:hypothetical protein
VRARALPLLALGVVSACGGEEAAPLERRGERPARGDEPAGAAWFEEVAASSGVDFTWRSGHDERPYFPEIMGGGAALLDMDADGDLDLYLVQGGSVLAAERGENRPGNALYRNRGDGTFEDVSAGSGAGDEGYGMGVAAGDFDEDGLVDLYVTNVGPNALLRNLGDGRFEDVTAAAGVGGDSWSTSAAFLDYDRDGDLDLFVVDYIFWSVADELTCSSKLQAADYCSPKSYDAPAPDVLYRNEGDGTFTDVSADIGLRTAFGNGLGVVVSDFDGDGFEDVFVANDGMKNQLWRNEAGARFRDVAVTMGCAVDQDGREKAGMGTHAVDVDDDGDEDLLVVNLSGEPDSFFRNDGNVFSDRTPVFGLASASRPYTRFGMGFQDFDQDGRVDLYQANGRVTRTPDHAGERPFDQPNVLFRGGEGGRFTEVLPRGGTREELSATSRAAAFGDLDGDGAVDVVVVNRDGPAHVLRNVAAAGSWITFDVRERSGRPALGATLSLEVGDRTLTRTVRSAYSYCAANDPRVHVGLGDATEVTGIDVTWADGARETFGTFASGAVVELARGAGDAR